MTTEAAPRPLLSSTHAAKVEPAPTKRKLVRWTAASRYLVLAIGIVLALSPSLLFSFGYHNDFNAWAYDTSKCCTYHPETKILLAIGRYFGAIAENIQFLTIHSLFDLWLWRFLAVISAAGLASYYLHIVSLDRTPKWRDTLLTVSIFALPTMQMQAIWVSMYMFFVPPILLALLGAHCFRAAALQRRMISGILFAGLGYLALLGGVFFYPMSTMFVLVPAAHLVLDHDRLWTRRMAALSILGIGGAFVSLFVIHKFIVLPHLSHVPYLGEYSYSFAGDLIPVALWRLREYFLEGAYLWSGVELPLLRTAILLLAAVSLCYLLVRLVWRSANLNQLTQFLIACVLFFVAVGPLLIVSQFSVTFRVTFAMTAIQLLTLFWLLNQFQVPSTVLASVFAAAGMLLGCITVWGTSASASTELSIYRNALTAIPSSARQSIRTIAVLRPSVFRKVFGITLRKDFGGLSPPADYAFGMLMNIPQSRRPDFSVNEFSLPPVDGAPLALIKDTLIVDVSAAYGVPDFKDVSRRVGFLSTTPRGVFSPAYGYDGGPEPTYAMDSNFNSYWEMCGPKYPHLFPLTFQLELPSPRTFTSYTLSTRETPERMPNSWQIWVSSDLHNWRKVQDEPKVPKWKIGETRNYSFAPQPNVKGIRLVIEGTAVGPCMRLYEFQPSFASK